MIRRQFLGLAKALGIAVLSQGFCTRDSVFAALHPRIRLKGINLQADETEAKGEGVPYKDEVTYKIEAASPFVQLLEKVLREGHWRLTLDTYAPGLSITQDPHEGDFDVNIWKNFIVVNHMYSQKKRTITAQEFDEIRESLIKNSTRKERPKPAPSTAVPYPVKIRL